MSDKICIVTGANSGIGKHATIGLAKKGATVIMLCRNEERGENAREEIIKVSDNETVDLILCDLSVQAQIRQFAETFKQRYGALHVLVNNAGIIKWDRTITPDGLETTLAVNYLAPFLLTHLLLDYLKTSAPDRKSVV